MKTVTSKWKECIVRYEKTMDNGTQKKVKEIYVVDALSFTEAEARITDEMKSYISGDFEVVNINPTQYNEIMFSDDPAADKWYKARLQFITLDEKTEKEKRANVYYLCQASSFENARANIVTVMSSSMIDYVIAKVEETSFMDVFVHNPQ